MTFTTYKQHTIGLLHNNSFCSSPMQHTIIITTYQTLLLYKVTVSVTLSLVVSLTACLS